MTDHTHDHDHDHDHDHSHDAPLGSIDAPVVVPSGIEEPLEMECPYCHDFVFQIVWDMATQVEGETVSVLAGFRPAEDGSDQHTCPQAPASTMGTASQP